MCQGVIMHTADVHKTSPAGSARPKQVLREKQKNTRETDRGRGERESGGGKKLEEES